MIKKNVIIILTALLIILLGVCATMFYISKTNKKNASSNSGESIADKEIDTANSDTVIANEENNLPASKGRVEILFNEGWKFNKLADGTELNVAAIDTSTWEAVTLPHTWNAIDGCDGYANTVVESDGTVGAADRNENSYYRGLGGYRKEYTFSSQDYEGKKIYIEFEGANTVTTLYVNGTKVGEPHKGGYSAFRYDITDYVVLDEVNVMAVTVDNSRTTDIAPLDREGDFTKFGGIYRDVAIVAVDYVHIDLMDFGADGVYVTAKNITGQSADTNIEVNITNDSLQVQNVSIKAEICDAEGKIVANAEIAADVKEGETSAVSIDLPLNNPHLWNGVTDPYLYSVNVSLSAENYNDSKSVPIGYRSFSIDNKEGLLLNDTKYEVYGVNYHQDSFENGWAMTDVQRDRDYAIMGDMGVTAVRMAHYQHDEYEYDICDKEGYIVWSEIPLINRTTLDKETIPTEAFCKNIKQQLMEMIKQNYNHPSILFWGISNELYDVSGEVKGLYTELCNIAKEEDPSRMTIYADNVASTDTRTRSEAADAIGYNRYDGWYYSILGDMDVWVGNMMKLDSRPTCVSEYGAGAATTQHKDNVQKKEIKVNGTPHYEEYQTIYHEVSWADICSLENVWGSFIWCMFDFASDSRVEGDTEGQNDKGLVSRDRTIFKDSFYFYKSIWNEENMVYITDRRYTTRNKDVPEVKVYSNADTVELFVNNISYGVVEHAGPAENNNTIFKWVNITLTKDVENEIKTVATYSDGTTGEDDVTWVGTVN